MRPFRYLTFRLCVLLALLVLDLGGYSGLCLWVYVHGSFPTGFFLALTAGLLLVVLALALWVYRPYRQTTHLLELFAGGYTLQGLNNLKAPYNRAVEQMIRRLMDYMRAPEVINETRRQTQYLALQNQINPHFLYNTLEAIRADALDAGQEGIAKTAEALATYFRYTITEMGDLVTVEDELNNIDSYFTIQRYRFNDKLKLIVLSDEDTVCRCKIPKLTLQPIVENSIFHGLESKSGDGLITIRLEATQSRILISIRDNGVGMSQEAVNRINEKLEKVKVSYISDEKNARGGIALRNVAQRIKLLFGEEYGLQLYSTPGVGTEVVINLPKIIQT